MTTYVTIAPDELTRWREALGMSQEQLGKAIGYSDGSISNWELDRYTIPKRAVIAILNYAEKHEVTPPATEEA